MLAVVCFWLVLGLPGYALLRRLRPDILDGGLPSNVALSYLATFALLSPVSVAGYALHLPLAVLSGAIALLVLGACVWLLRNRPAMQVPKPSLIAIVVFAFIVCDSILGLRVGSFLNGDATYHVARVRMLVDNGFNSWDPAVYGGRFEPIYHTNLYHAVMAAACQLTSRSAPEVWVYTLFWAKLIAAASTYHLARVVLGARWLAWTAAATFTAWMGPVPLLTVPHNVAAYFLLALGLGFAVEVLLGEQRMRAAIGLAVSAALLPQFHGLCYLFLGFAVAPVLLGRLAYAQLRRLPERRALLFAVLALGVGAPWFGPHLWERVRAPAFVAPAESEQPSQAGEPSAEPSAQPSAKDQEHGVSPRDASLLYRGFVKLPGGMLMFDPAPLKDWNNETAQLLLALVAGLCGRRRPTFLVLAAMAGVVLALLYFPPLCTLAVRLTQRGWIIARFNAVLSCLHFAAFPGALLLLVERLSALGPRVPALLRRCSSVAFQPLALIATLAYAHTIDTKPWSRTGYWHNPEFAPRKRELDELARQQALFSQSVPHGALLAADPGFWHVLGMVCDCYPLALPANLGDYGVPDMAQRREALAKLIYLESDLIDRVAVARHYGVHHVFVHHTGRRFGQRLEAIYAPITAKVVEQSGMAVISLAPERFEPATTPP